MRLSFIHVVTLILMLASQSMAAAPGTTIAVRTESPGNCQAGQSCTTIVGSGSAVVLSRGKPGEWRAVTAAHVVKGMRPEQVKVAVGDDWRQVTEIYRVDGTGDVAFLAFTYAGVLVPTETCEEDATSGDQITFDGFSSGKTYEESSGSVVQTGMARCVVRPKQGQSGGGVYCRGRLVGVVTGYDQQGHLVYEPLGRVRTQCVRQWGFWIGFCRPATVIAIAPPPPVDLEPHEKAPQFPPQPPPVDAPPIPVVNTGIEDRIRLLERKVAELSARPGVTGPAGPQGARGTDGQPGAKGADGPTGPKGPQGNLGTVTVILQDSKGKELGRADDVPAGSFIDLDVTKFKTSK